MSRAKTAPSYRPDVDGLRAVAVLSVILFHLKAPGFEGGYVGVDVFFVISGYLITRLIEAERSQGSFSFKEFYLRRVRRLAPALVFVSVPVSVAALAVLYPEDMRSFAASLVLQFVALQNVFFLADGEYFRGADTKPLLHTWTLAVEEQFYLLWPLLLVLTSRLRARVRLLVLAVVMASSFALNIFLMEISPKAAFFLLPPRAWELGVGGLIALLEAKHRLHSRLPTKLRLGLALSGLLGIAFSIGAFSPATAFPGVAALLPVLGTAALVVSGIDGPAPLRGVLQHRWVLYVGLISYPAYLWHWPLIALAHQVRADPTKPPLAVGLFVSTLALAHFTYRFVETPVRQRVALTTRKALLGAFGASALALTAFGAHSWITTGAAYRYSPMAQALLTAPLSARKDRCGLAFRVAQPRAQVCSLYDAPDANRRVLLWGNSHAGMWSTQFIELGVATHSSVFMNARNCRPTPDHEFCGAPVQRAIFEFIHSKQITDVVLASTWHGAYHIPDEVFERGLRGTVDELANRGVRVWLVVDTPAAPSLDPLVAFESSPDNPRFGVVAFADYERARRKQLDFFASLTRAHPATVRTIDPSTTLCDGLVCQGGRGNEAWYRDAEHLTDAGARAARLSLLAIFSGSEQQ